MSGSTRTPLTGGCATACSVYAGRLSAAPGTGRRGHAAGADRSPDPARSRGSPRAHSVMPWARGPVSPVEPPLCVALAGVLRLGVAEVGARTAEDLVETTLITDEDVAAALALDQVVVPVA